MMDSTRSKNEKICRVCKKQVEDSSTYCSEKCRNLANIKCLKMNENGKLCGREYRGHSEPSLGKFVIFFEGCNHILTIE